MSAFTVEIREACAFLLGLLRSWLLREARPATSSRRIAIVTRMDIFPANHGGAVKIVQTARSLSLHYDEVVVITQSHDRYYIFRNETVEEHQYPLLAKWFLWQSPESLRNSVKSAGFPQCDEWMALPSCDRNFKFRTLFLAVRRPFQVIQAEFSPYVFACDWMSDFYPGIMKIAVEHNVEFLRLGATYSLSAADVQRMKDYEISACNTCDCVVAVSEVDRDLLAEHGVDPSRLTVIPLGVDLTEYRSVNPEAAGAVRKQYGFTKDDYIVIFHGVLSYKPNHEAVRLLATEIMPPLRAQGIPVKCLLVGLYPPVEYADADIVMTGPVEHLSPYIKAADVAVVPLLDGGGTRLKILEYFAAGIPVISTTKGAEGIKAENGKEILVEDSMEGIASLVAGLWDDPVRRKELRTSAKRFVQQFDWDRLADQYISIQARAWDSVIHDRSQQNVRANKFNRRNKA